MTQKGMIIVMSGFSGAGKGTIVRHMLRDYPDCYHLSISATTRAPRQGEQDGREYFFRSREQFDEMIAEGEFLEHATFNGNSYGTPRFYVEQLVNEGKDVILEIEIQGALQIKKIYPEALLLFVMPPSAQALKERLVGRGTESAEVIAQRLSISNTEARYMPEYDYLIVNDIIDDSVKQVHTIISGEHYRCSRNAERIAQIQQDLRQFEVILN